MRSHFILVALIAALAAPVVHGSATPSAVTTAAALSPGKHAAGRNIYRKYCGQCHALRAALAVGFGQEKLKTDPGPSFNRLRVPFKLSISAVVLSTIGGHETIQRTMRWQQLYDVARWLDQVTKQHPVMAPGIDYLTGR